MAKDTKTKKSSLLAKYTLQYQKKPRSRVFAPLAETYRNLGMYDEALKILRSGLKYHPTYTLGYIVLAHIYHDQQNDELAYNTLRPFVTDNLENISLQKLFAQICINLGYLEESLQTYKYLLLMSPKDTFVAEQIKLLEDDLLVDDDHMFDSDSFVEKRMANFDVNEDEWIQVDFGKGRRKDDELDQWSMQTNENLSPIDKFKDDIASEKLSVNKQDLNDDFFKESYDNQEDDLAKDQKTPKDPIITHTLVDLYCKQGHFDKALEILESIIELHPSDEATKNKITEIKAKLDAYDLSINNQIFSSKSLDLDEIPDKEVAHDFDEQSGHDELYKLVEGKKEKDKELLEVVKEKLEDFVSAIKIEATRKQLNL